MIMKKLPCLVLTALLAHWCNAQIRTSPHQWTVTLKALDETGQPVAGADVWVAFSTASPEGKPVDQRITGLTDTNGVFATDHTDRSVQLAFHAEKAGYYPVSIVHYLGFSPEKDDVNWNAAPILTLKRVLRPIPMYAKFITRDPPVTNKPVGYDLTTGDWVPPYGKGQMTDIVFLKEFSQHSRNDYDYKLTVSFPKQGDGLQEFSVPVEQRKSGLRSPHEAPESDYEPEITRVNISHPPERVKWDYDENRNYFFRVRTVLDERGNVKSGLYGKIYGDFMQFCYYLNPTPNDRNIEFDPKRNLLSGQNVDAP